MRQNSSSSFEMYTGVVFRKSLKSYAGIGCPNNKYL